MRDALRNLLKPPKKKKKRAGANRKGAVPRPAEKAGHAGSDAVRPAPPGPSAFLANLAYAAFAVLSALAMLVPLGAPFDAGPQEAALVVAAAFAGAYLPDLAAPEGRGPFLGLYLVVFRQGRRARHLDRASRAWAPGAGRTHEARAVLVVALAASGLWLAGAAGGAAGAAACLAYAAHVLFDAKKGRHGLPARGGRVAAAEVGPAASRMSPPKNAGGVKAARPGRPSFFGALVGRLPGPPKKKRRVRHPEKGRKPGRQGPSSSS